MLLVKNVCFASVNILSKVRVSPAPRMGDGLGDNEEKLRINQEGADEKLGSAASVGGLAGP